MRKSVILFCTLALSACAGGSAEAPIQRPVAAPPAQPSGSFRAPEVQRERGIDGVIGARAAELTRRFGSARIDLAEGDARKLQFSGRRCVLDIFLYPLEPGQEPVATHVEARLRKGGDEVDRGRCISEISGQN
ncbi:MAG: hypothetical protein AAF941_00150 [Pseudomonadota bacterium]